MTERFCSNCGQPVSNDAPFCGSCGHEVGGTSAHSPSVESRATSRRKRPLIIGVLVALVLLAGGGGYFYLQSSTVTGRELMQQINDAGLGCSTPKTVSKDNIDSLGIGIRPDEVLMCALNQGDSQTTQAAAFMFGASDEKQKWLTAANGIFFCPDRADVLITGDRWVVGVFGEDGDPTYELGLVPSLETAVEGTLQCSSNVDSQRNAQAEAESVLKNAATAMESYAVSSNGVYTSDVSLLAAEGLTIPPSVDLIAYAEEDGFGYCMEATAADGSVWSYRSDTGVPEPGPCF